MIQRSKETCSPLGFTPVRIDAGGLWKCPFMNIQRSKRTSSILSSIPVEKTLVFFCEQKKIRRSQRTLPGSIPV